MANLLPEEQLTLEAYDALASTWSGKHSNSGFWQTQMDVFQKLLPAGDLLEIGTGGARDAPLLIERGYNYTGSDISAGLIKIAKEKLPNTTIVHQSVYDLDFRVHYLMAFGRPPSCCTFRRRGLMRRYSESGL